MRIEFCDGCGAPLEARWNRIVLVCRYCGAQNAPGGLLDPVPSSVPDDGTLRFAVDGRTYLVQGLLAHGDACDVYLGRWVRRLGEQVVIKILRSPDDRDLLKREWTFLKRLHESPAQGTPHFSELIPEPIAHGPVRIASHERQVAVYRWRCGFVHSLEDVRKVHPQGVDGRIGVWILKRLLELLHWSHLSGVLHGAVLPPHVLIHPRHHGAMLIGWSTAAANTRHERPRLPAKSRAWKEWYLGSETSRAADVALATRSVLWVTGATNFQSAGTFPALLASLLLPAANGECSDAWELCHQLSERSRQAYGPPVYCPLKMPGW